MTPDQCVELILAKYALRREPGSPAERPAGHGTGNCPPSGSSWEGLKGQVFLGGVTFVEGLIDHLRKHKDVPEIPKNHRFVNRPQLGKIFTSEYDHEPEK